MSRPKHPKIITETHPVSHEYGKAGGREQDILSNGRAQSNPDANEPRQDRARSRGMKDEATTGIKSFESTQKMEVAEMHPVLRITVLLFVLSIAAILYRRMRRSQQKRHTTGKWWHSSRESPPCSPVRLTCDENQAIGDSNSERV